MGPGTNVLHAWYKWIRICADQAYNYLPSETARVSISFIFTCSVNTYYNYISMQLTYNFTCRTGILVLLLIIFTESLHAQNKQVRISHDARKAAPVLTYKIIHGTGNTFGYDVYTGGILQVHQPQVPALAGNHGFATKGAAAKVARLVIEKIKKGEMPPVVSIKEMKNLGVL